MSTGVKSICFFGSSIILGTLFYHLIGINIANELNMESWFTGMDAFYGKPFVTAIFSIPLFIPIVHFFRILKTYKPYFPLNVGITAVFGLSVSTGWVFILNVGFKWLNEFYIGLPFVVASTVCGALLEIFTNKKGARLY